MKVAFFSDSYLPVLNGVSIAIRTLVDELRARGIEVYIFAPRFPRHRDDDPEVYRFPAVMTPFAKGYPLAFPPFGRMFRRFNQLKVDLIHTHTPYTVGFCALKWAQQLDLPIVSTYHTLYENYQHYIPFLPQPYVAYKIRRHTGYYYNLVDCVLTPSQAAKDSLLRHDIRTPVEVVPTGIPDPEPVERSIARRALDVPDHEFMLLYVGRVAQEKNLELLIGCMRRWRHSVPDVRLHVVGGGRWKNEIVRIARTYGLNELVKFHGVVPPERVSTFMAAADVFVFPSMTETQGLVIGEALAMGMPAIAVEGGGAREAITHGDNGFVVPDTIEAFAGRVELLASRRDLLVTMGENARHAPGRLTPPQSAERVVRIYERVLGIGASVGGDPKSDVGSGKSVIPVRDSGLGYSGSGELATPGHGPHLASDEMGAAVQMSGTETAAADLRSQLSDPEAHAPRRVDAESPRPDSRVPIPESAISSEE